MSIKVVETVMGSTVMVSCHVADVEVEISSVYFLVYFWTVESFKTCDLFTVFLSSTNSLFCGTSILFVVISLFAEFV